MVSERERICALTYSDERKKELERENGRFSCFYCGHEKENEENINISFFALPRLLNLLKL
jgi:hypothetical protein